MPWKPEASSMPPDSVRELARELARELRCTTPLPPRLIDAKELAMAIGTTPAWVREHAGELGAISLGSGKRPRLRFDPEIVAQRIRRDPAGPNLPPTIPPAAPAPTPKAASLLPIRAPAEGRIDTHNHGNSKE